MVLTVYKQKDKHDDLLSEQKLRSQKEDFKVKMMTAEYYEKIGELIVRK